MLTMYFCCESREPIIRCWPAVPRVGDTVSLPELESEGSSFRVTEVLWEGDDHEPTLSIHLKKEDGLLRRIVKATYNPTPCADS